MSKGAFCVVCYCVASDWKRDEDGVSWHVKLVRVAESTWVCEDHFDETIHTRYDGRNRSSTGRASLF